MFFEGPNDDRQKFSKIMASSTEGLEGVDLETTSQRIYRMVTWISLDHSTFYAYLYTTVLMDVLYMISYFGMCLLMM